MKAAHKAAGYDGTISDGERQRLQAALGLTSAQAQKFSINDLYIKNGERPKL
jgi:hypothetical protein